MLRLPQKQRFHLICICYFAFAFVVLLSAADGITVISIFLSAKAH